MEVQIMRFSAYTEDTAGILGVAVKSCGHIFARQGRTIDRPHGRDDWLIFYISHGQERFCFQTEITAGEGSFVIFRPREKQQHVCISDKVSEFYYVHFTAPENFDPCGLSTSTVYTADGSTRIIDIFEEIIREAQMKQPCHGQICACRMLELLAQLKRGTLESGIQSREHMDKIAFAVELMHREYSERKSLDEYAVICHMSKYHFLRTFKNITGCSPVEYRNAIRLEHAKEMLEDGNLSVGEIGEKLGFSSASYFCDAFKRKTGLSPVRYRELRHGECRAEEER
ncbi:MAG: helix-turn-helix transcriptional regulator [Ruminococcaceae bacterium]|nr:helix-turn-helix transcriptional regulator [Oscillospiraceae bacterium]